MAAQPLATRADVEARLRRELTTAEAGPEDRWINGFLEEASALVTSHCGRTFEGVEIPSVVRLVTSRVAARGVTSAASTGEDQRPIEVGPVRWPEPSADAVGGGGWLTRVDKKMLSPWVVTNQVFSVDMA